jgi:hypothetical protein
MRDKGVICLEDNGLKLVLGPQPLTKEERHELEKKKTDPLHRKREHFSNLLGRFVGDKELELLPDS